MTLGTTVNERRIDAQCPLEIDAVDRLRKELGGVDREGGSTLESGRVEFRDRYIVSPWRIGGWYNRTGEDFALRLEHETGCVLADCEHSQIIALPGAA